MTDEKEMLKNLKDFISSSDANNYLTWKLGYKSNTTVRNWLLRKSIPPYMIPIVSEVMKKYESESKLRYSSFGETANE